MNTSLLLYHSVITLVLSCTVLEILQVFCAPGPTPIPVFMLHQIAHVGVNVSRCLSYSTVKLFLKYSNLCVIDGQAFGVE